MDDVCTYRKFDWNLMHRHIDAIITHEWKRGFFISRSNHNPNALHDAEGEKKRVKDWYGDICMVEGEISRQSAPM
jgi:hypothetical protein